MPLDEQLVVMVEHLFTATPEQLARGEVSLPEPVPAPVNGVVAEDRTIAGKHGPIPVRCYRPEASLRSPLAAFVWNHGGGWTQGDLEMPEADAVSRRISLDLGCVVVSVGYRLAPA
jgi:acetyl esterase/lipase